MENKIKEIKNTDYNYGETIIDEYGNEYTFIATDDVYSIYQGVDQAIEWTIDSDSFRTRPEGSQF